MYKHLKVHLQFIMLFITISSVISICPNSCSGHGICDTNDLCTCFTQVGLTTDGKSESYTGIDCSIRKCPVGNPFSTVYSKYPSTTDTSISPNYRVLSEIESKANRKRNLKAGELHISKNFQNDLISTMQKPGGLLECYYGDNPVIVDVKGFKMDIGSTKISKSYVTFDIAINDTEINQLECKIITQRTDLTMLNPTEVKSGETTITWERYSDLLLDIGVIKFDDTQDDTKVTFNESLSNPKFACYDKTSLAFNEYITTSVKAVKHPTIRRRRSLDTTHTDIEFTFTSTKDSVCYLLAGRYGEEITIENSDLGRNADSNNIGKYKPTQSESEVKQTTNGHTVIVFGSDDVITNGKMTIKQGSIRDDDWKKVLTYLNVSRTVYLTLQDTVSYQIYEYPIQITNTAIDGNELKVQFNKIPIIDDDDKIFQYVRTFPSDDANLVINSDLDATSRLYKLYNFKQDKIVKELDNVYGGLLKCTYNDDSPTGTIIGVVDIKGYKMNYDENVLFTYVKFEYNIKPPQIVVDARLLADIASLKSCDSIIMERNDLSYFNPVVLTYYNRTDSPPTGTYDNSTYKIEWIGYEDILENMGFQLKNKKVKFACKNKDDDGITLYNIKSYKNGEFALNSNNNKYPELGDICYLLSNKNGESIDIMDTDFGNNVREEKFENGTVNYYFKAVEDPTGVEIITDIEDNNTMVALDGTTNKIEIDTDGTKVTITVKDEGIVKDILVEKREVYISLIYDNIIIEEKIILETVGNTDPIVIEFTRIVNIPFNNFALLNYIRTYPVESYSLLPKISLASTAIDGSLWKVYNLNTEKVPNLPSVGGKLKCKDSTSSSSEFEADVKGKVLNDTQSTYVLFGTGFTAANIATITCDTYLSIRNDLSMYNPTSVTASYTSFEWGKGYGRILYDMGFYPNATEEIEGTSTYQYKRIIDVVCIDKSDVVKVYENVTVTTPADENGILASDLTVTFTFLTDEGQHPTADCICYILSDSNGNKMEVSETDLGLNIRKENDEYKVGKFEKSEVNKITTTTEEGRIVIITPEHTIELSKSDSGSGLDTLELNGKPDQTSALYLQEGLYIYLTIKDGSIILPEFKTAIKTITPTGSRLLNDKTIITINPPIPAGCTSSSSCTVLNGIRTSPNDLGNDLATKEEDKPPKPSAGAKIPITPLDNDKNLYSIKDSDINYSNDLISQMNKLGGTIQCKYEAAGIYPTPTPTPAAGDYILGTADIKSYDTDGNVYIQFAYKIISTAPPRRRRRRSLEDIFYDISNIKCDKVITTRNDLSLMNPSTVEADDGKTVINWLGYKTIFKTIGFISENNVLPEYSTFACLDEKNQVKMYNATIELKEQVETVKFVFKSEDEKGLLIETPDTKSTCYLLSTEKGKVLNIEETDLYNYVRKNMDGTYHFGKYVEVKNDIFHTEVKLDGSVTLVIGRNNVNNQTNSNATINIIEDKIYIPISKIEDATSKMMVVGSYVSVTEILKLSYRSLGTFQIMDINFKDSKVILTLSGPIPLTAFVKKPTDPPRERLIEEENTTITADTTTNTTAYTYDNNSRRILLDLVPSDEIIGYEISFTTIATTHVPIECSGQGECDRTTGQCKCYKGFTGYACQRIDCPNNCNGNGRCVPLSELLSNSELKEYKGFGNSLNELQVDNTNTDTVVFKDQLFGCLCDKRHRGFDCSLIECPSDKDPIGGTNIDITDTSDEKRDCSGRGICNYNTGVCECFDGFSGEGCQKMSSIF